MSTTVITPAPHSPLVVPLAAHTATDMRSTDTAGRQLLLFQAASPAASGAASPPIGAIDGLQQSDVACTIERRTPATPTTPGCRTSATATRTTITSRTATGCVSSAELNPAPPADFSFSRLVEAYLDCRRAKRNTPSARDFEQHQEALLYDLHADLAAGTWQPGRSTCFVITRPKPREVWAAPFRDRIVHHLLYNRIAPAIERSFIADTCACIPGRGTLYAARRLEAKVRSITQNHTRPAYYLKLDLANFFVTIDKPVLRDQLTRRIADPWWRALALQILLHDPRTNADIRVPASRLALVPPHKSLLRQPAHLGLPIGNLSSQFFANVYLDALDQYAKHTLHARHYIRYVDDIIILGHTTAELRAHHDAIATFLPRRLHVALNPAKTVLQPVSRGIDFVGHLIKPHRTLPRRRTVHALLQRMDRAPLPELHRSANSAFGLLRQSTHSHTDRTRLANLLRRRGLAVDHRLTKAYTQGNP